MKHILFDFDGTLMDTWPGIEATIIRSLDELGVPGREGAVSPALVGMPLKKVFEQLLEGQQASADAATQRYRDLFPTVGMPGARPYPGAPEMLQRLKSQGRDLYLVTARNESIARQMLREHQLTTFFTWVRGEREGEVPESKVHMVTEVVQRFGLRPHDCVMVGDRSYDMDAALGNGIKGVGVTYGYGTGVELKDAGAARLAATVRELKEVLLGGEGYQD